MKKVLYITALSFSITALLICSFFQISYNKFNADSVIKNTSYFSNDSFKGRFPGTYENDEAADKISELFRQYNLDPVSSSYKEPFIATSPTKTDGNCTLSLIDSSNKQYKQFKLGEDFKEDSVNFKSSSALLSKNDSISIYQNSFLIEQDGHRYLFYVTFDKDFSFRSSFFNECDLDFAIQINTKTFNDILDGLRSGYSLSVSLPYLLEQKEVFNVAGLIRGYDKTLPPIIITAHFDHLGTDTLNNVYYGALDNASGVSFLLELARYFSSIKLVKRDIIFVCLNCEEFGLKGSEEFAKKYSLQYPGSQVINFDMIGSRNAPILLVPSSETIEKDSALLDGLKDILDSDNKKYSVEYSDSSDHVSFSANGFDSLTISNGALTDIHTPDDTYEKISTDSVNDVFSVVNKKILDDSYNKYFLIFYDIKTLVFFLLTSIIIIVLFVVQKKEHRIFLR